MPDGNVLVTMAESTRFIVQILEQVIPNRKHVKQVAEILSAADYIGSEFLGIAKLVSLVNNIERGVISPLASPVVSRQFGGTTFVSGNNAIGAVVGNFCMTIAISKAEMLGIGIVVAGGSNSLGPLSWYSSRALHHGLMGLVFSNASPSMCPPRAKMAALGSNPVSVAARATGNDKFQFESTVTTVSMGRISSYNKSSKPIPAHWAKNQEGEQSTDSYVSFENACLYPLGGSEATGGYKGYMLGIFVEMLCGLLSGHPFGPFIPKWQKDRDSKKNLSHCFIVINPRFFAEGFDFRLGQLLQYIRSSEPVDETKPVLVHGDLESAHMHRVDVDDGVYHSQYVIDETDTLAEKYLVPPLKISNLDEPTETTEESKK